MLDGPIPPQFCKASKGIPKDAPVPEQSLAAADRHHLSVNRHHLSVYTLHMKTSQITISDQQSKLEHTIFQVEDPATPSSQHQNAFRTRRCLLPTGADTPQTIRAREPHDPESLRKAQKLLKFPLSKRLPTHCNAN
jgi:hypothetical protein